MAQTGGMPSLEAVQIIPTQKYCQQERFDLWRNSAIAEDSFIKMENSIDNYDARTLQICFTQGSQGEVSGVY
jgi:hypothetical protein